VLFSAILAWCQGAGNESVPLHAAGTALLLAVGGGIAVGFLTGLAVTAAAGRTSDHLIESTLTTVAAYGSFVLAERFHSSGVLATVSAGLVIGNLGIFATPELSRISNRGREFVLSLWDFAAFIANSLVFLMIGLTVAGIRFERLGLSAVAIAIALSLLSRGLTVYPLSLLFIGSQRRIPMRVQHILWWGGLRGALALALALSLPPSLPLRGEILIATFGVVVFSVVVQGSSMSWVLGKSGAAKSP